MLSGLGTDRRRVLQHPSLQESPVMCHTRVEGPANGHGYAYCFVCEFAIGGDFSLPVGLRAVARDWRTDKSHGC